MKKLLSYLILLAVVNSCKTDYTVTEKKSGFAEIKSQETDSEIEKMIQPYRDSIAKHMEVVIGTSEMEMTTGQPESLLGNFVCDALFNSYWQADEPMIKFPYFVLLNHRGLRAPLPKGEIKVKHIYEIMPFENTIVYVEMKGSDLEDIVSTLILYGGHPVSYNFKLETLNTKYKYYLSLHRQAIDTNEVYTIITTDYLANGGDNMNFFVNAISKKDTNYKLRDFLIDHIKKQTKNGKTLSATLDERIKLK